MAGSRLTDDGWGRQSSPPRSYSAEELGEEVLDVLLELVELDLEEERESVR